MKEPNPAPAVPRGWKMNKILPFHSAAVTGGGVSENFFNDMMKEMQGLGGGQAPSGMVDAAPPASVPSSGKPKKEKRKFIRG
jgi:signal recognition particle subunit SRP19